MTRSPPPPTTLFDAALAALEAGEHERAEALFREILKADPANAAALANLGRLARLAKDHRRALELYEKAAAQPDAPREIHFNRALTLADLGHPPDTVLAALAPALADPPMLPAWRRYVHLVALKGDANATADAARRAAHKTGDPRLTLRAGVLALEADRPHEAAHLFCTAARTRETATEAETRLGEVLMAMGDGDGCVAALQRVLAREPQNPTALRNLATALRKTGHYQKALTLLDRLAAIDPDTPLLATDRNICLVNLGRAGETRAHFDAVAEAGEPADGISAALMASLYDEHRSAADVRRLHERAVRHWPVGKGQLPPRPAGRPLTVGFLSADFRAQHPVSQFVLPLLPHLAAAGVKVTLYLNARGHDATAAQTRETADIVLIAGMDDEAAAERIRKDAPDILIDLSGHTAANRLKLLGHRIAPIHMGFVGYPSTTGFAGVDVLVADPVLVPEGHEPHYTERIARLPHSFLCFNPPPEMPVPAVSSDGKRVRFGSLNHLPKLNAATLELWARVLKAAPEAELLIKCGAFAEPETRTAVARRFRDLGVDPDRLVLEGPEVFAEAMKAYRAIDVALDPTPYNGGTTSAHALYMGCPLVTLPGDRFCARMGASLLSAAGRPEWIARDSDEYVAIAARLAADPKELRATRRSLIAEVPASPMCDLAAYARAFADLLHAEAGRTRPGPPQPTDHRKSRTMSLEDKTANQSNGSAGQAAGAGEAEGQERPRFEIGSSRNFEGWLAETGASLVFTTYQAGMVIIVGTNPETGRLWIFNRHIQRPMGIACDRTRLAVASLTQITTFVDGHAGTPTEGADPVYVPQIAHYTGDLDAHDLAFTADGSIVFVNTLFSCLATVSPTHSFRPVWRPPFISRLAAEDRCHLNGLAMKDGRPAYVTAVATTDVADGWRDNRADGGVVIDVETSEIVARGLSMPHSPRLHDGRLWVLNAGTGELGTIDLSDGRFTPVTFCPGFLRGFSIIGDYALVGASEPREDRTFGGLALQERLEKENMEPRCGVFVVDLTSGDVVHWMRMQGVVTELYDIAVIPSARKPSMIGFRSDEIRRVISIDPCGPQS